MERIFRDVLFGLRILTRAPGFSALAITALALGIGANSAIFSVVNFVLLRPLPYEEPEKLVWIWDSNSQKGIERELISAADFTDWRNQNKSFLDMAAIGTGLPTVNTGDDPEQVLAGFVTTNYFSLLGAMPMMGRTFSQDEDQPGKDHVLVSSYGFWKSRLGSDPNAIGRGITLGAVPYYIVGVMPASFIDTRPDEYKPAAFWIPRLLQYRRESRRDGNLAVVARLRPEASITSAQQDMNAVTS